MNTKLARLSASPAAGRDRRRAARYCAEVTARLHSSHGHVDVLLVDVSTHGCSVRGDLSGLRAGSFIAIGLGDKPALQAIVRWLRDGAGGLEFLHPVPREQREWHRLMESPFDA